MVRQADMANTWLVVIFRVYDQRETELLQDWQGVTGETADTAGTAVKLWVGSSPQV